ncbi:MAG: peptidyl-prolyl cis-trans isomerase, partial [Deltaproteobacteria bacterium]|nr:peptidyl-prolyl cis-trans isomerase [Deltaproteobacteria bacterium]
EVAMLAFLRRNAGSRLIKILLGAIALSFLIGFGAMSYVSRANRASARAHHADSVATVGTRPITRDAFLRRLEDLKKTYTSQGLPSDSEIFSSPFFLRSVLAGLVDQTLLQLSATDLGIAVTEQEIADYIRLSGGFVENGQFSKDRLLNYLRRSGMSLEDFETAIRYELLGDKVSNLLRASVVVTDEEAWQEFRRDRESRSLRVVKVEASKLTFDAASIGDDELKAAYDADTEAWREPEQRRLTYFSIDFKPFMDDADVTDTDLRAKYDADPSKYSAKEQVRYSRIRVSFPENATDAQKAEAREKADGARAAAAAPGADFAPIVAQVSDDIASRAQGGDMGFAERTGTPRELVTVAFGLADGAVSEVIETDDAFEIVKRTESREPGPKPFDEVKDQIRFEVELEHAKAKQKEAIEKAYAQIAPGSDIRDFAAKNEYEVGSTPLFAADAGIPLIVCITEGVVIAKLAFEMSKDEISKPFEGFSKWYIFQLAEVREARLPSFDEAKDRVRAKLAEKKRQEMATAKAADALAQLKSGSKSIEAVATELGTTVVDTGEFAMSARSVPQIGFVQGFAEAAFAVAEGQEFPAQPFAYSDGAMVFQVAGRQAASRADFEAQKDAVKQAALQSKQAEFLSAWVAQYREKYPVVENQAFWGRIAQNEKPGSAPAN